MFNFQFPIFKKGFSLVEFLIVIGILSIVMVAVYALGANIFINSNISSTQITNTWQAQSVLKPMTKELRNMIPSATGSYPLFAAATSSVTFFANVDGDNEVERIRYFLTNATLYRGFLEPSGTPPAYVEANETLKILANGIVSSSTLPLFEYFDGFYEGTSSPMTIPVDIATVRLIRINLTIDTDPRRAPNLRTFTSSVSLRNLKNNL